MWGSARVGATLEADAAGSGSIRRATGSVEINAGLYPPAEREAGSLRISQEAQHDAEESAAWLPAGQQGKSSWHPDSAAPGTGGGHGHGCQSPEQSARVMHVAATRRTKLSITFNRGRQEHVRCHARSREWCASARPEARRDDSGYVRRVTSRTYRLEVH